MSGVFPNANPYQNQNPYNPLGFQQPGARTMPMPMQHPQGGPAYTNPTGTAPLTPPPAGLQPATRTVPEPMTPPPAGIRPAGVGQLPANNPIGAWAQKYPQPNFAPQMPRSFGPMGQAGGK